MMTYEYTTLDEPRVTQILEQERPRLFRLCLYWLGDAASAEDATQEVLIEAWQHVGQLRDPHAISGWLSGIARNVCARWHRRQGRQMARYVPEATEGDVLEPFDTPDFTYDLERSELATLLDRALAQLPSESRLLLIQKYLEEQSNEEIAARLGLSSNATAVRLHRGKLALRAVLAEQYRDESQVLGLPATPHITNIWCSSCGQERLVGTWTKDEFILRCPVCHPAETLYYAQTKPTTLLKGLKSFRPALSRFTTWMDSYLRDALPKGVITCHRCGHQTPIHLSFPATAHPSLHTKRGLHIYCEHCEAGSYESLNDMTLGLAAGRAFFRAHARIHVLPQQELNYKGVDAIMTRYQSVTDSASYAVIVKAATYEVLTIAEGGDSHETL